MGRPSFAGALKEAALKLARYVGEHDATACRCGHSRREHCGCGTVCLAPENHDDHGKGSYRHCACNGFAPEV